MFFRLADASSRCSAKSNSLIRKQNLLSSENPVDAMALFLTVKPTHELLKETLADVNHRSDAILVCCNSLMQCNSNVKCRPAKLEVRK